MASHHAQIVTAPEIRQLRGWTVRQCAALAKQHDGQTFVKTGLAGRPFRGYKLSVVKAFERGFAPA